MFVDNTCLIKEFEWHINISDVNALKYFNSLLLLINKYIDENYFFFPKI